MEMQTKAALRENMNFLLLYSAHLTSPLSLGH